MKILRWSVNITWFGHVKNDSVRGGSSFKENARVTYWVARGSVRKTALRYDTVADRIGVGGNEWTLCTLLIVPAADSLSTDPGYIKYKVKVLVSYAHYNYSFTFLSEM